MKRRYIVAVALLLTLLALLSISVDFGRTLRIADLTGSPVEIVFVVYHHEGHRPNLVHPVTYEASRRSVAQSQSAGLVRIPPAIFVHKPFPIETHPRIIVDLIYAPALHNAHATIVYGAVSRPGISHVDADLAGVSLGDLAGNPAHWEGTLRNLGSIAARLLAEQSTPPPRRAASPETAALTGVLGRHFAQEYESFLARYGDVDRPRPEVPPWLQYSTEEERRAWKEMVDRDLAREPRWGDLAHRLFAREARRLSSVSK